MAGFISTLTRQGMTLLTKVTKGDGQKLLFTKIQVGDGQIVGSNGELIEDKNPIEFTKLEHVIRDVPITQYKITGNGTTCVSGKFDNEDLETGFFIWEYGLFAEDPETKEEILYNYTYTTLADWFPSFKVIDFGNTLVENTIGVITAIGRATDVEFIMDKSSIYVTAEQFETEFIKTNDHINNKTIHVTHEEKELWNSKASTDLATNETNGLMSSTDKQTLNNLGTNISENIDIANNNINDIKNNTDVKTSTRATQTSVDDIKSIFDNVKLTITNIINNIGVTSDAGGSNTSGTVMAKLNAVLNWFNNTWTTARAGRLDFLDASISSRASTADLMMIKNQTDRIGTLGASVIKSIQRGVINGNFEKTDSRLIKESVWYLSVKIGEVNPSKCILLANAYVSNSNVSNFNYSASSPVIGFLDTTTIKCSVMTIPDSAISYCSFREYSWQVIEFY